MRNEADPSAVLMMHCLSQATSPVIDPSIAGLVQRDPLRHEILLRLPVWLQHAYHHRLIKFWEAENVFVQMEAAKNPELLLEYSDLHDQLEQTVLELSVFITNESTDLFQGVIKNHDLSRYVDIEITDRWELVGKLKSKIWMNKIRKSRVLRKLYF